MRRRLLTVAGGVLVLAAGCANDSTREAAVASEVSVRAFAATPDGRRVAYGTEAGNVVLLDLYDEGGSRLLWKKCAHREAVASLSLSPDGRGLLSASADGEVVRWNTERAKPRRLFACEEGGSRVGFSPDGRRAFALGPERGLRILALPGADRGVAPLGSIVASAGAFAPDSEHVVAEARQGFVIWDVPHGFPAEARLLPWPGHQSRGDRLLVVAGDGASVLAAGPAGVVRWDLVRNAPLWEKKTSSECEALSFARGETRVVAVDRTDKDIVAHILDAATGEERRVVSLRTRLPEGHVALRAELADHGRAALLLCELDDEMLCVVRVSLSNDLG